MAGRPADGAFQRARGPIAKRWILSATAPPPTSRSSSPGSKPTIPRRMPAVEWSGPGKSTSSGCASSPRAAPTRPRTKPKARAAGCSGWRRSTSVGERRDGRARHADRGRSWRSGSLDLYRRSSAPRPPATARREWRFGGQGQLSRGGIPARSVALGTTTRPAKVATRWLWCGTCAAAPCERRATGRWLGWAYPAHDALPSARTTTPARRAGARRERGPHAGARPRPLARGARRRRHAGGALPGGARSCAAQRRAARFHSAARAAPNVCRRCWPS